VRVNTNYRVTLKVNEGTSSHFITAKIRCETGVFGVDPSTLEMCDDRFDKDSKTWHIPVLLKNLKDCLVAAGGLRSEGVFRLAGELTVLKSTKEQINRLSASNAGPGCVEGEHGGLPDDVNDLATLIKIWYRELPQPILNGLPTKAIVDSAEVEDCVAAAAQLPQLQHDLFDRILELLLRVASNRATTKMTAQNLAIVVAPNLYEATTPDPMQGLVMSQKAVQFVHNILVHMVHEREKATGTKLDTELHKKDLKHTPCSEFSSKGPVLQPVTSQDELPLPEDVKKKAEKKNTKKKKTKSKGDGDDDEKKKKKHHHHHHHHSDNKTTTTTTTTTTTPPEDSKKEEAKKTAEEDGRPRKESHANRSRHGSHADRSRKDSHADRSRKGSHADRHSKKDS